MKALTVVQPWALLLAHGVKEYETRGRSTTYRGPLVLHASKRWTKDEVRMTAEFRQRGVITQDMLSGPAWAFGSAIAMIDLVGCLATEVLEDQVSDLEHALGNFSWDRFGWQMANPRLFELAVPARGMLGLWEYSGPVALRVPS